MTHVQVSRQPRTIQQKATMAILNAVERVRASFYEDVCSETIDGPDFAEKITVNDHTPYWATKQIHIAILREGIPVVETIFYRTQE